MSLNFVRRVLTRHQNPEKGLKHRTTPRVVWRLSCRPRAGVEFTEKLLIRTSAHPVRLKCPKRAMAGAWPSLNNRPVRPAPTTATRNHLRRHQLIAVVGRTTDSSRAWHSCRSPPHERDAPWQPNPAARPQPPLLATSGPPRCRHPARLTQDRVPLGQGRQATLPEDPRRPPPLPRSRDPRTGRGTSRGSHDLNRPVFDEGRRPDHGRTDHLASAP